MFQTLNSCNVLNNFDLFKDSTPKLNNCTLNAVKY
jgi:hypothetical protein